MESSPSTPSSQDVAVSETWPGCNDFKWWASRDDLLVLFLAPAFFHRMRLKTGNLHGWGVLWKVDWTNWLVVSNVQTYSQCMSFILNQHCRIQRTMSSSLVLWTKHVKVEGRAQLIFVKRCPFPWGLVLHLLYDWARPFHILLQLRAKSPHIWPLWRCLILCIGGIQNDYASKPQNVSGNQCTVQVISLVSNMCLKQEFAASKNITPEMRQNQLTNWKSSNSILPVFYVSLFLCSNIYVYHHKVFETTKQLCNWSRDQHSEPAAGSAGNRSDLSHFPGIHYIMKCIDMSKATPPHLSKSFLIFRWLWLWLLLFHRSQSKASYFLKGSPHLTWSVPSTWGGRKLLKHT